MKRKVPNTSKKWCREIIDAFQDAVETIPLGELIGTEIKAKDLFTLAPNISIKFRGISPTEELMEEVIEAAFCSVAATQEADENTLAHPFMAFALTYLASNLSMGFISEKRTTEAMVYIEENLDAIAPKLKI